MRDTEAVELYYAILEATPGKATELGADIWCETVRHLDYTDARASIAVLLRSQTFVSAADLCSEVTRLQDDRERRAPLYTPSRRGMTVEEELTEMRAYRKRVRAGETIPEPDYDALPQRPALTILTKTVPKS